MTVETDLRAALLASPAVTALVGTRVVSDRMEEGAPRPFVVFTRTATRYDEDLTTGAALGGTATIELQVWADSRAAAEALADACEAAVRQADQEVQSRASGYDPDLDVEAVVIVIDWWWSA